MRCRQKSHELIKTGGKRNVGPIHLKVAFSVCKMAKSNNFTEYMIFELFVVGCHGYLWWNTEPGHS
jgi:UDP-N-acetylmuramyl pentapeptide phosphotransferase/UDP-N-acetylglucosamine-1-phosphate transferase